jgi:protein involved in polysaccharide export with SLBB domain
MELPPEYARSQASSSGLSSRPVASLEGAIDATKYVLGPGDLLEVVYTGRPDPSERVRVTPSGRVHLAPTGPIPVAGLTLAEAEEKIRKALSRYYSKTTIGLDLLEVRTFRVHVLGHIENPGAREVTAANRVSDLFPPEEPKPTTTTPTTTNDRLSRHSERNLILRHANGNDEQVDLVRYRALGQLDVNPFLRDGDVLFIPPKRDSVSVFGWVARSGFIEFREGDTVDDLVALAGGFDSGADRKNVELRRFDPSNPDVASRRVLNLEAGEGSILSAPGDGVYIRADLDWRRERLVEVYGEVRYPGVYAIQEGKETLRQIIERAGGFTEEADPAGTRVERANVFDRPEEDPEFQRLQNIPISEMEDEEYEYLKLRSRQREGLSSAMLSVNLTAAEGGEDLVLRSGDRVTVPRKNLSVDVQGAIKNPGFVPYDQERTARDYINLAGGASERARTGTIRIIRKGTGEWVEAEDETRVDPGDMVWVPEKPARDWWRISREVAIFLASLGTLIVVVDSVND